MKAEITFIIAALFAIAIAIIGWGAVAYIFGVVFKALGICQ